VEISDLYLALIIGSGLSLLFTERTGIMPAGIIVPGYLALVFDQPVFVLMIFLISIVTYITVNHGVRRFTILYGKRKFAAMMIAGVCFKLIFDAFYPYMPFEIYEFRGIGVIVPGLIANTIERQGAVPTFVTTILLSAVTFGLLLLNQFFLKGVVF